MEALTTRTSATTNTDSFTPRFHLDVRKAGMPMIGRIIPVMIWNFKDFKEKMVLREGPPETYSHEVIFLTGYFFGAMNDVLPRGNRAAPGGQQKKEPRWMQATIPMNLLKKK